MQIFKGQATQKKPQYCSTNPQLPIKNYMFHTVYISGRLICDILETGNTALPFPETLRTLLWNYCVVLSLFFINMEKGNFKVSLQTNSRPLADTFHHSSKAL